MHVPEFNEHGERMVLGHDPVPPYPKVFWITFLAGLAYLAFIIISTSGQNGLTH
ncbi:MAG: hypothetical protein ACOCWT_02080 [Desulfohalobiaceae bacterium]